MQIKLVPDINDEEFYDLEDDFSDNEEEFVKEDKKKETPLPPQITKQLPPQITKQLPIETEVESFLDEEDFIKVWDEQIQEDVMLFNMDQDGDFELELEEEFLAPIQGHQAQVLDVVEPLEISVEVNKKIASVPELIQTPPSTSPSKYTYVTSSSTPYSYAITIPYIEKESQFPQTPYVTSSSSSTQLHSSSFSSKSLYAFGMDDSTPYSTSAPSEYSYTRSITSPSCYTSSISETPYCVAY